MNLSSWMILVFLLSAGTSLAAVNVNWLTHVVDVILRTVKEHGLPDRYQFSLAANIPLNQDPNTIPGVLNLDRTFKKKLMSGAVYQSSSLVTAQNFGADHAEYRVLLALPEVMQDNSAGHVLIIYSLKSPCSKCTGDGDYSILPLIKQRVTDHWREAVFVFTKVYDKRGMEISGQQVIGIDKVTQSLENLGVSMLDLANIFRCYPLGSIDFQCHSCSVGNKVSKVCVDNNFVPGEGGSSSQTRERSRSPIRGGFIGPQIPGSSSSREGFIGPQRGRYNNPGGSGSNIGRSRSRSRSGGRGRSRSGGRGRSRSGGRSRSRSRSGGRSRSRSRSGGRSRSRSRSGGRKGRSSRKSEKFWDLM